jgi:phosphoesterase RecJ-like protein
MLKLNRKVIKQISDFKKQITQAKKILVTSHFSPDDDAISSALSTFQIIKNPSQKVYLSFEDNLHERYHFLNGFSKIKIGDLTSVIKDKKIDTIVFLDGNELQRFSRNPDELISYLDKHQDIKKLCLDHHFAGGQPKQFDLYLNLERKSTAEQVYLVFQKELKTLLNQQLAQTIMVGILGDTNRFLYHNPFHKDTFEIASLLIDKGVEIEDITSKLQRIDSRQLKLTSVLFNNLHITPDYNYTYFTDQDLSRFKKELVPSEIYSSAQHSVVDSYIRYIDTNQWGFVLIPDYHEKGVYKGSFRATNNTVDTTVFTQHLGGGGHKPASGFKILASNWQEALTRVNEVIKMNLDKAIRNA